VKSTAVLLFHPFSNKLQMQLYIVHFEWSIQNGYIQKHIEHLH